MDDHVAKETATGGNVRLMWWIRVAHSVAHDLDVSEPAIVDHFRGLGVGLVESALKSDLQLNSGNFRCGDRSVGCFQIERDRLLAKDLLAGCCGSFDQRGVRIGRCANDDRIDRGIFEDIGGIGGDPVASVVSASF
ncbi:MAG: hypothetical protein R2848_10160 [Thermomicrobiales bacterium]